MRLGRVVGCVWSTVKHPGLEGQRLLVVQPVTPALEASGRRLVCADCTGAGAGEIVYWCSGKEASFPFLPSEIPVDTTIVGIVDSVRFQPSPKSDTAAPRGRKVSRKPLTAGQSAVHTGEKLGFRLRESRSPRVPQKS